MLTLTAAPVPTAAAPPPLRITAEQFVTDIDAGRYSSGRKVELLDGVVVLRDARDSHLDDPTMMGVSHIWFVTLLRELLEPLAKGAGAVYREEKVVLLPPFDGPQPDGLIARGPRETYRDRYPGADDVLLLIEVADSSLASDRTTKARIYASAGVPVYWILNVPDRALEVHTDPDREAGEYRSVVHLTAADAAIVPLPTGPAPLPLAGLLG